MTVCKFFQQGSCRYGQNCRFEHIYGSKYSYHSNAAPQQATSSVPASVTDEQLLHQVHTDVQAVLRGGQWLLSSYAPFKEKPAFPGITDLSPEEARLFIYEAKSSNKLDQAVTYMNNMFKQARTKYEQLLHKNPNITRILRSLYNAENVASPFDNTLQETSVFGSSNAASSIFRSALQTSPFEQNNTSVFQNNQTPSVFTQNMTPSIFQNTVNTDVAKSIFAQATQSSFGNQNANVNVFGGQSTNNMNSQANIFGMQTESSPQSIFAQASQNVFSPPNAAQSPSNLFASASHSLGQSQQTPFGQNQTNIFQKSESQSTFGGTQNIFQQINDADMSIYSKLEDLSPEQIEAYKSDDFKLGFIPELPPPLSLCR